MTNPCPEPICHFSVPTGEKCKLCGEVIKHYYSDGREMPPSVNWGERRNFYSDNKDTITQLRRENGELKLNLVRLILCSNRYIAMPNDNHLAVLMLRIDLAEKALKDCEGSNEL